MTYRLQLYLINFMFIAREVRLSNNENPSLANCLVQSLRSLRLLFASLRYRYTYTHTYIYIYFYLFIYVCIFIYDICIYRYILHSGYASLLSL